MKSFPQNVMHHLMVYFSHNERKKNPEAGTLTRCNPCSFKISPRMLLACRFFTYFVAE